MTDPAYSPRFDESVALAMDAFRGIYRKGTTIPYVTHLFSVAALVGEHGGDEDQMIAAILHDYLEDVPEADPEHLRQRFGDRVTRMVIALSDSTELPKPPWRDRKEAYLAALPGKADDTKLVSAADKLHNCRSLHEDLLRHGPETYQRFRGGLEGTLWYYQSLVTALGESWSHPILELLALQVARLVADTRERQMH